MKGENYMTRNNYNNRHTNLILFIIACAFLGIGGGINDSSFNNFLDYTYKISAFLRGSIEFPRETPGFLLIFITGFLYFLGDKRISLIATLLSSISLLGLAYFAPSFSYAILWIVFYNTGTHLNMILNSSIGMSLSEPKNYGRTLGNIGAVATAASIIGYLIVFFGFRFLNFNYKISFSIAAIMYFVALLFLFPLKIPNTNQKGFKIVIKKEYWLYYMLSIFWGARKQIFLTFAPWVLIKIFKQPVSNFAIAGILISLLGILFRKILGKAIDLYGEKNILTFEAIVIIIICIGYTLTQSINNKNTALILAYSCYIIDNLMMAATMARSTYIKKIIKNEEDLTPTLAAGTSMDHAVSMTLPIIGGLLWSYFGYYMVFLLAGFLAFLNLLFVKKMD